jgi:hypothetical protein
MSTRSRLSATVMVAGALAIAAPAAASAAVPGPPAVPGASQGYTETVCPHGVDYTTGAFQGDLDISPVTIAASPGA